MLQIVFKKSKVRTNQLFLFQFHSFSIQREYFILFHFIFISRSFYLIEVIRASQQFNCLQGKDATPPTLFIYLTSFKDTFVIQQNFKKVLQQQQDVIHIVSFVTLAFLFFLRVFTISQYHQKKTCEVVLKFVLLKRNNFQALCMIF